MDEKLSKQDQAAREELSLMMGLRFAFELGYLIAIPAVLFGFGGAYVDKYMHMSPLFFLVGMGLALILSAIGVFRKIREITTIEFGSPPKKGP
jgi:F0F1-type ATP synthase assembly protein I